MLLEAWGQEKQIFLQDILEINITIRKKARLVSNFYRKLSKLEIKILKLLFGTLLVNKDINPLVKCIIKGHQEYL